MKNVIHAYIVAFLLFIFVPLQSYGQLTADLLDNVKESIQTRIDFGKNVGIVVGIIDINGPRYYSYGKASLSRDQILDEHSVFEIGSITKVFTAIMLADMVSKNEVGLDDPIEQYLPDKVSVPSRNNVHITLAHLATHTSGLPRMPDNFAPANPSNPFADYSVDQMYDFLSNHTLRHDAGVEYEYSNYGTGLLGHILALRSGMTYEELFKQRIADVICLDDTRITLTSDMEDRLAKGYSNGIEVENWDIPTLAGAGALRSTVRDMLRFIAANMGLEETPLYAAMQATHEPRVMNGPANMKVGLGWVIRVSDDRETIWHNGGTGGYRSFAGFVRGGGTGVVVLTNSLTSVDDIGFHLLDPSFPIRKIKPSIAMILSKTISEKGVEAAIKEYHTLKDNQPEDYDFNELELNNLGYRYLQEGEVETAIAIFKLNVQAYPESSNTYDSLGESYMEQGNIELAILNYKKSLELNQGNENAKNMLIKMGVDVEKLSKHVVVAPEILQTFVGKYQLAQSFIITITRDGEKLMAQATGQRGFEIFPMSETKFFYKVVDAQITFNLNEAGEIESLMLHQGGRNIPGRKVE
jgi:CubicO group peptidase (beta-lactamase class C family)